MSYEWDYMKKKKNVIPRTKSEVLNGMLELLGKGPTVEITGGVNPALSIRPLNKDKSHYVSKRLDPLDNVFVDASQENGVPIEWLKTTAIKESQGDVNVKPKRGSADRGIMQIRNPVWDYYRTKGRLKFAANEQDNPVAGIHVAARYFADMKKKNPKWTGEQLVSGYNKGETQVNEERRDAARRKSTYDAGKTEYVKEWQKVYNVIDSLEKSRRGTSR